MRGPAVVEFTMAASPCITVVVRLSGAVLSSATARLSGAVTSSPVRSSSRAAAAGAGGRPSTDGPGCGSAGPTTRTTELTDARTDGGVAPSDAGNLLLLDAVRRLRARHGATLFYAGPALWPVDYCPPNP